MQPMRSGRTKGATQAVAADGMKIRHLGVEPKPGGYPGKAAVGEDGSRRCCKCYSLIPAERGKSPYCASCKEAAVDEAARNRDNRQADAAQAKRAILSAEHWTGPGFLYGKDGSLYLDPRTVAALRDTFGGALSVLTDHAALATRGYDARNGEHYHRVLGEVLEHIENLNAVLRIPLYPRSSGRRPPKPRANPDPSGRQ